MKLSDAREHYYYFSGKLSDVTRQLSFAGIAVVWIFVISDENGHFTFPDAFLYPLTFFVIGLVLDLLHYTVAAASWGIFHRSKEKSGIGESADFGAPIQINHIPLLLFWSKVVAIMFGYGLLLQAIVS